MVVTIGGFATAGMLIFSLLCIIVLGIAALTDSEDSPIAVGISITCIVLWIVSVGTLVITHVFFSDDYSKHKLEYLTTTKHEQLIKQCPNEEGLCRLNWLDYRADSLKAEYQVQRAKFDD